MADLQYVLEGKVVEDRAMIETYFMLVYAGMIGYILAFHTTEEDLV